jgi:hypothetical protein
MLIPVLVYFPDDESPGIETRIACGVPLKPMLTNEVSEMLFRQPSI